MLFYASDPPNLLENIEPGAFSTFSRNIEFSMKTAPRNESKFNAEIITNRFCVGKGATSVDLEYFLAVFRRLQEFDDFQALQKSTKKHESSGPWGAPGRGRQKKGP